MTSHTNEFGVVLKKSNLYCQTELNLTLSVISKTLIVFSSTKHYRL